MKVRSSFYVDYRRMAEQNYQQLQTTTLPGIVKLLDEADEEHGAMDADQLNRFFTLQHLLFTQTTSTIVFAAMAAEGFIFDYGAQRLSASYIHRYLEKLDVVSKWVIVPRLVTGKELATGGQGLNLLRKLVKHRNELVHYKSTEYDPTKLNGGDPAEFNLVNKTEVALGALNALAAELEVIDPTCLAADRIGSNAEARWHINASEVEPW